jgi:hypothetical protein
MSTKTIYYKTSPFFHQKQHDHDIDFLLQPEAQMNLLKALIKTIKVYDDHEKNGNVYRKAKRQDYSRITAKRRQKTANPAPN